MADTSTKKGWPWWAYAIILIVIVIIIVIGVKMYKKKQNSTQQLPQQTVANPAATQAAAPGTQQ
jgi:uncharacterized membrane protein